MNGLPAIVSFTCGLTLWVIATLVGGRTEVWDNPAFWTVAYPASLGLSCVLGFAFPFRTWLWPLLVFAALELVITTTGLARGGGAGLLPFGLAVIAVLALPGIAASAIAGWVARRR